VATRVLLTADHHLMNDPNDLTEHQIRTQFTPVITTKKWVPLSFVKWLISRLRHSALVAMARMNARARKETFDYHVTVGDQLHGISERGMEAPAAKTLAWEFLAWTSSWAWSGSLFHVPSEHPLGYWDGEDYIPHIEWKNGWPSLKLAIKRDIGGAMNIGAILEWEGWFGSLWGEKFVNGVHLVWITGDFFRWADRIDDPALQELARQQDEFLKYVFNNENPSDGIVLFTHRLNVAYDVPILWQNRNRIRAVVFADYHDPKRAAKAVAGFPAAPFQKWFVPAVWGVQFGLGNPGYGVLTLNNGRADYQSFDLI